MIPQEHGPAVEGLEQPVELKPIPEAPPIRLKPARSPFLTRPTLMLLGMFAAGLGGLYAVGFRGGPSTALADQTLVDAKVEAALSLMSAAPTASEIESQSRAKAIVNEFYTAARQRQIDLDGLRGNPFIFRPLSPEPNEPNDSPAKQPDPPQPSVDKEEQEAMKAVEALALQTVLVGKTDTIARISNNLVTTGQTIQGWTVVRIGPKEVELSWRDKRHVLRMSR
jgi:hypothetical protein